MQVLTIHGAKGLEWDLVVVPRLVDDELPRKPIEGTNGWLAFGQLPWPFRGDAAELPDVRLAGGDDPQGAGRRARRVQSRGAAHALRTRSAVSPTSPSRARGTRCC